MRYIGKLTLVFLLVLYIGPLLFISSYGHTALPTEPNMVKDFALSDGEGWFNVDWTYRKTVTITGSSGAGINYQVRIPVTYDSDMQFDFDDLRFTAIDGVTEWAYWIESYMGGTSADVWVNVSANLDTTQYGYMYYGNDAVSTTSNGTNTFLFYEDWASESVDPLKWDTIDSAGSIAFDDTDADHGSVIQVSGNAGASVYQLRSVMTATAPTSIIGRVNVEKTLAASQRTAWGMSCTATNPMIFVISNEGIQQFMVNDDDGNSDHQSIDNQYFGSYYTFMITRDGTTAKLYADYVEIESGSCAPDTNAVVMALLYVIDSEYQVFNDWTAGRKFIATEPVFDSFGAEEDQETYPQWYEVGEATLYFVVPFNMWGYNSGLIILGLVMIPVSMLYLAYGIKHDRSSDRLFYGLILFFMGCGLFIGGIIP